MRRVLTDDVTIEDCMYALEETEWEVNNAIKLVKLKQLLSLNMGDKERCKQVLMLCGWNVNEAANFILQHPPSQDSPEVIHVWRHRRNSSFKLNQYVQSITQYLRGIRNNHDFLFGTSALIM